jgi:transcription elongation factor Elf1
MVHTNPEILSELYKDVCEALNCNANATVMVHVKAGSYGLIVLSLCNNCVNRFEIEGQVGQVTTQANSNPNNASAPGPVKRRHGT